MPICNIIFLVSNSTSDDEYFTFAVTSRRCLDTLKNNQFRSLVNCKTFRFSITSGQPVVSDSTTQLQILGWEGSDCSCASRSWLQSLLPGIRSWKLDCSWTRLQIWTAVRPSPSRISSCKVALQFNSPSNSGLQSDPPPSAWLWLM